MSNRITFTRVVCFVAMAMACGGCNARQINHPTEANVVPDARITARIQATTGGFSELAAVAAGLRGARRTQTIAVTAGEAVPAKFERIDELWVTPRGEAFVADSRARFLGTLADTGEVRGLLDANGGRPPGSDGVRALAAAIDGTILISNGQGLAMLRPGGAGYEYVKSIPISGRVEDICSLGGAFYLRAPTDRAVLTRLTSDGSFVGTFGDPYRVDDPTIRGLLSQGLITCVAKAGTVVAMFSAFPEIYGFTPDGAPRWISRVEDFKRPRLVEERHGGHAVLAHAQKDTADRLVTLMEFETTYVIVQIMRRTPNAKAKSQELHSYVVDGATGHGEYIGTELPWLLAARGSTLLAEADQPLRVDVYSPAVRAAGSKH